MPNKRNAKAATADKHHGKHEKPAAEPKHEKAEKTEKPHAEKPAKTEKPHVEKTEKHKPEKAHPKPEKAPKAEKPAKAPKHPKEADDVVTDMPEGPVEGKKHRRGSSITESVAFKAEELAAEKTPIVISKDVARLNWKMNTSPSTIEDFNLDQPLTEPPLKAVHIWFPSGIQVTARNLKKGVTIKDALKAIYKLYHKKADDELDLPVLDTIEWTEFFAEDRKNWGSVLVKQKMYAAVTSKKKSK